MSIQTILSSQITYFTLLSLQQDFVQIIVKNAFRVVQIYDLLAYKVY